MIDLVQHVRRIVVLSMLAAAVTHGAPDALAVQTAEDRALHAQRVVVRALTFMRTGYPDRAVDVYTEGLRVNPREPVLLSGMADAREAVGDLASARFYAARAVENAPDNPTYLEQLARISTAAGDMEEALSAYDRLSDAAPDLLDPQLRHVDLLLRLDRLDEAIERADAILERHPSNAGVLSVQADLLHRAGRTSREITVLRRLLEIRPEPDTRYALAVALERTDQSDAALEVLTDLLTLDPDDLRARELFLGIASARDDSAAIDGVPAEIASLLEEDAPADSAGVYRRRLEADPDDSDSAAALARILAADGRALEAAEVLVTQTGRDPRRPDLWISAIEMLTVAEAYDRAALLGEEASLLYPGYPPLALSYTEALIGAGREADALEVARNARSAVDASDPLAEWLDTLIAKLEKPQ